MGNYRFKLSDMTPNAWFRKLRDMNKARKKQSRDQYPSPNQHPLFIQQNISNRKKKDPLLPSRASYHFSNRTEAEMPHASPLHPRASDTLFPQQSPSKSKKCYRRKPISPTSKLVSSGIDRSPLEERPFCSSNEDVGALIDAICGFKLGPASSDLPKLQLELPPIMTKPEKAEEKKTNKTTGRSSPTGTHRLRARSASPRVATTKKVQICRKSVSKQDKAMPRSFAVMKSSTNPQKDFRESMVEMIKENNIKTAKELEELLACYLLLNSNEYHDVIIEVFEHIWFDLTNIIL